MEQKKAETGVSALKIVGGVCLGLGIAFIPGGIIGLLVCAFVEPLTGLFFLLMFGGPGFIALIAGIICLVIYSQQKQTGNKVLQDGYYVMAKMDRIYQNRWVHVWGKWPYVVECSYRDRNGIVHKFKSGNMLFDPKPMIKDDMVRVYVSRNDFSKYYVDIPKPQN